MLQSISVVLPAYNAAPYVADAIRSVYAQTFRPLELITVDDGSTDDTSAAIGALHKEAPKGFPVHHIRQQNAGVMMSRNRGIAEAQGDWIAFLDADDVWFPRKLEAQAAALNALPANCLLCSHTLSFTTQPPAAPKIDVTAKPLCISVPRLLQRNHIGTSTVLVPKAQLRKAGCFSQRYNHAEDWALWLRIAAGGTPVYQLPQTLAAWRATPNSLGTRNPRYLRDVEVQIIKDFVKEHDTGISSQTVRMALAGNHIRTALNYSNVHRYREALQETLYSIVKWPFSLPEYSKSNRLLRLRMTARFMKSLINPHG